LRKARIALVGLGGWGGEQGINAVKKNTDVLDLITWFDASPEVVEQRRSEMPVPPASSWQEVLENPNIEGVILVVPNHVHTPLVLDVARHGKHVFIEKPLANTLAECDEIVKACDDAGVILQTGHCLRRVPAVRKAKQLLDEGRIGELVMLEGHQSHRGGWTVKEGQWRWYNESCPGGPLNLLGIHQIDNMHYLAGPSVEVNAMFAKKCLPAEIPEITQVIIRFESGILGYIGDTYVSPAKTETCVYGTEGFMEIDCLKSHLKFYDIDGKLTEMPCEKIELIPDEYREFAECIITGKQPETGGAEGRAAVALMEAAIRSARTGQVEKIDR